MATINTSGNVINDIKDNLDFSFVENNINQYYNSNNTDISNYLTLNCSFYASLADEVIQGDLVSKYAPFRNLIDKNGTLKDFETDQLEFDLNHPVQIEVQDFPDGSVNLILNDDVNIPKLINSRFSVAEDKTYIIPDHIGNKDTNLYEEEYLELDTSLQKFTTKILKLEFTGLQENGVLPCGTYHFYFRLMDNDGNMSDFVAESAPVMVHIGSLNDPYSIRMGLENEKTNKSVGFNLSNLDGSYDFIKVYYTRSTSGQDSKDIVEAYEILTKFPILGIGKTVLNIYGTETKKQCSLAEINAQFEYIKHAKTAVVTENRLFLGNIQKSYVPYEDLKEFSLHFYPIQTRGESVGMMDFNFKDFSSKSRAYGYYNTLNIYYRTGYWPEEFYRFGIVYILKDFSLSPVFDIQGVDYAYMAEKNRSFQKLEDNQELQYDDFGYVLDTQMCQNIYGITTFRRQNLLTPNGTYPLGVRFLFTGTEDKNISKYINGYFFVRQKRKPIILAQGVAIGKTLEGYNNFPCVKKTDNSNYFCESFLRTAKTSSNLFTQTNVTHLLGREMITVLKSHVSDKALIVPDAVIKEPTFNQIFTSTQFWLEPYARTSSSYININDEPMDFRCNPVDAQVDLTHIYSKCTMVNSGMNLTTNGTDYFSARAGEESDVLKALSVTNNWDKEGSFIPNQLDANSAFNQNKVSNYIWHKGRQDQLLRGLFGTYVGTSAPLSYGYVYNIKDKNFDTSSVYLWTKSKKIQDEIRKNDTAPYFAISDRIEYKGKGIQNTTTRFYRGDCFICNFTHRMMRNFIDSEFPTNDKIVEPTCWDNNFLVVTKFYEGKTKTYINEIIPKFKAKMIFKLLPTKDLSKGIPLSTDEKEQIYEMIQMQLNPNYGTTRGLKDDNSSDDFTSWYNKEDPPLKNIKKKWFTKLRLTPASKNTGDPLAAILITLKLLDPAGIGGLNVVSSLIQAHMSLIDEEDINYKGANLKIMLPTDSKYDSVGGGLEKFGIPNTWFEFGVQNINRSDVNSVGLGHWLTVKVLSNNNLCMRDIDMYHTQEYAIFQQPRSFYPLQRMSLSNTFKQAESGLINGATNNITSSRFNIHLPDIPYIKQQYDTRIVFSDAQKSGSFVNSFRIFTYNNYKDYTKTYGALVKMVPVYQGILAVMEHGVLLIPINERVMAGANERGQVSISSGEVLPDPIVVSDMYGSFWPDSVLNTGQVVYGVDTIAKKIWAYAGNQLQCISDFKVQRFLNENIDLAEWDLKFKIGERNVKTHYNANKRDVMFTFYNGDNKWNLCYNEYQQSFQTFYDWIPSYSENIDNVFFTLNLQDVKNTLITDYSDGLLSSNEDGNDLINIDDNITLEISHQEGKGSDLDNYEVGDTVWTFTYKVQGEALTEVDFKKNYGQYFVEIDDTSEDADRFEVIGSYTFQGVDQPYDGGIIHLNRSSKYTITFKLKEILTEASNMILVIKRPKIISSENEKLQLQPDYTTYKINLISNTKKNCKIWKHSQAGIYDGQGSIKPSKWYGRPYPFSFEFVVCGTATIQKIFNNLMILSNRVQPDEISVEVIGDGYEWYPYKELIKYCNKASSTTYQLNLHYKFLLTYPPSLYNDIDVQEDYWTDLNMAYDRQTPFEYPEIKDLQKDKVVSKLPYLRYIKKLVDGAWTYEVSDVDKKFYNNTSDCDIVEDQLRNEERMLSIQKCKDIKTHGRVGGNIEYKEDQWFVELRSMNIRYAVLNSYGELELSKRAQPRLRDKYARIRITYSGKDLALIYGVQTLFEYSYC